jgi:methionyl-tRNA formyltransferase
MSSRPRTVFLGTPEFAVPALRVLADRAKVVLVITQPDRPIGRGRKVEFSPVKKAAIELGIEIIQPKIVKGRRFSNRIKEEYAPDFVITAAFGRLLGPSMLKVPKCDSLNIHASLLPKYRGAAPINWAILSGEQKTGVSIMRMEDGLDTGPVFSMLETAIFPEETTGELSVRLAEIGARAIVDTIENYHELSPVSQNHDEATWAPMLKKSDGLIDWNRSVADVHNHVRGMSPWPCAFMVLLGNQLKVHKSCVYEEGREQEEPGVVLKVSGKGVDVACKNGIIRLVEVQAAGRKRLDIASFLSGTKIEVGQLLA